MPTSAGLLGGKGGWLGRALTLGVAAVLGAHWVVGLWAPGLAGDASPSEAAQTGDTFAPFDTATYSRLETTIRSNLPSRRLAVPLVADLGYYFLGRSMTATVWQGSDGYLFFGQPLANCEPIPAAVRRGIERASRSPDSPLRLVVIKEKSTVERERLPAVPPIPSARALAACAESVSDKATQLARDFPTVVRNIGPSYEQSARFGQPPFTAGDTHWTPAAATNLALTLGPWLDPHLAPETLAAGMTPADTAFMMGDLYRLAGVTADLYRAPIIKYENGEPDIKIVHRKGIKTASEVITPGAPIAGRTLIVHDSFTGTAAIPTTAPLFQSLTLVRIRDPKEPIWGPNWGPPPRFDRVIVVLAERHAFTTFDAVVSHDGAELKRLLTPAALKTWTQP